MSQTKQVKWIWEIDEHFQKFNNINEAICLCFYCSAWTIIIHEQMKIANAKIINGCDCVCTSKFCSVYEKCYESKNQTKILQKHANGYDI